MKHFNKSLTLLKLVIISAISLLLSISCAAPQTASKALPNRPPTIQQISGPSDWSASTTADITCSASDPDGDNLTYSWTADNGTISGFGPTISWKSPATMGKYNVRVTVSDGRGNEAKATQEVRVLINEDGSVSADAPVILKMVLPSKDTVSAAKRVRIWTASPIECIIESADSRNLKYSWTTANGRLQAGKGLSLEGGTASKVNWIAPGAGGDFTVNVTVTDSSGNEAKGQVDFKVFCCGN